LHTLAPTLAPATKDELDEDLTDEEEALYDRASALSELIADEERRRLMERDARQQSAQLGTLCGAELEGLTCAQLMVLEGGIGEGSDEVVAAGTGGGGGSELIAAADLLTDEVKLDPPGTAAVSEEPVPVPEEDESEEDEMMAALMAAEAEANNAATAAQEEAAAAAVDPAEAAANSLAALGTAISSTMRSLVYADGAMLPPSAGIMPKGDGTAPPPPSGGSIGIGRLYEQGAARMAVCRSTAIWHPGDGTVAGRRTHALRFQPIEIGRALASRVEVLCAEDVVLMDAGVEVFVWVGEQACTSGALGVREETTTTSSNSGGGSARTETSISSGPMATMLANGNTNPHAHTLPQSSPRKHDSGTRTVSAVKYKMKPGVEGNVADAALLYMQEQGRPGYTPVTLMMQGSETPPFRSLFNGWSTVLAGEGPRKGSITNRKGTASKGSVLGTGGINRKMSSKRSVQVGGLEYHDANSPRYDPNQRSGSVLTRAALSLAQSPMSSAHASPPPVLAPAPAARVRKSSRTDLPALRKTR
jgi:hypothetical protein